MQQSNARETSIQTGKRLRRDTSVSSTEATKYDMSSNNDTLSMDSTNKSQSYK